MTFMNKFNEVFYSTTYRWIQRICLWLVFIMAVFGIFIASIAVHEYSHKYDLRDISKGNESICALNLPTSTNWSEYKYLGMYSFLNTKEVNITTQAYLDRKKASENYAQKMETIFLFPFVIIILIVEIAIISYLDDYETEFKWRKRGWSEWMRSENDTFK